MSAAEPAQGRADQPAAGPALGTSFACMTLNMDDRIRFLNFPTEVNTAMTAVVRSSWPPGLGSWREYGGAHEIVMRDAPWNHSRCDQDTSRRLVRDVFAELYGRGWVLQTAVNMRNDSRGKGK